MNIELLRSRVIKKCKIIGKLLLFISDFSMTGVYSISVTKTEQAFGKWMHFKLVCHCERYRLSKIGCA